MNEERLHFGSTSRHFGDGMKATYRVLCLDTSMTATGYILLDLPFLERGDGTIPDPVTRSLYTADRILGQVTLDDAKVPAMERIGLLCQRLGYLASQARTNGTPVDFVVAETPDNTIARQGTSMHAIMAQQRTFGAVGVWMRLHVGLPFLEVTPQNAKFAATGNRNASKETVHRLIGTRLTGKMPEQEGGRLPRAYTKAVLDAMSVGFWASSQLRMMRAGSPCELDATLAEVSRIGL